MIRVFCIGEMLVDMVDVDQKGLLDASMYERKAGGAAANVALGTSKLGIPTYFLGNIGTDSFGEHLYNTLIDHKVNDLFVCRDGNTTIAWVGLTQNGERSFEFMRGSDGDYSLHSQIKDFVDNESYIHFGSATAFLGGALEASYYALLKLAVEKQATVIFDPNYRETLIADFETYAQHCFHFMKAAQFVKLSCEEAFLLSNTSTIDEAMTFFQSLSKATFLITLGKDGTVVSSPQGVITIPSIRVMQVDSTGAGDAFVSAFIYALTQRKNLQDSIQFANKAGALTTTRFGAIAALPTLEEIQNA